MNDYAVLNQGLLARNIVPEWLPDGRREGHEWDAINPTRDDRTPGSFKINMETGQWSDFATGDKGGDLISLYGYLHGKRNGEAAEELRERYRLDPPSIARKHQKPAPNPTVTPAPDTAPPLPPHPNLGVESATWPYHDADGQLLFVVARYDPPGQKKTCRPWTFREGRWVCRGPDGLRPLYRLPELLEQPDRPVVISEGEKAADAAGHLLPDHLTATSAHGADSAGKTDWEPLRGRSVLIWPDADAAGQVYLTTVSRILKGLDCRIQVIDTTGLSDGFDAADALAEGWTDTHVRQRIREFRAEPEVEAKPEPAQPSILKPWTPIADEEWETASLTPVCFVEGLLYADVGLISGAGGVGKTTHTLYEMVCMALDWPVWGCRNLRPGRSLLVTAEDSRERCIARLREIANALHLTPTQQRTVRDSIHIVDVSGLPMRLAEQDASGNLVLTGLADQLVTTYRNDDLIQAVFDPTVNFSPGEHHVNDGDQVLITACRRINQGLGCAVRLINHTGKANARAGVLDQYAGRNSSALADGARMVTVLANARDHERTPPDGWELGPAHTGYIMARPKLSFCPDLPNIWIRRQGYVFEHFVEEQRSRDEQLEADCNRAVEFLLEELPHGRRYTPRSLEHTDALKIPQLRLRKALARLETVGRIEHRELPKEQQQGRRKTYLHPIASGGSNALGARNTP